MSARVRRRLDEMLRFPFIHSLHHTHCSSQKCAAQTLTDNCIVCIVGSSELSEPGGHDYAGSPQVERDGGVERKLQKLPSESPRRGCIFHPVRGALTPANK